jgi:hypothetical protein
MLVVFCLQNKDATSINALRTLSQKTQHPESPLIVVENGASTATSKIET